MKFDMIIFDLDGTLWEVHDSTYKSVNSVLKKYNINKEITMETIRNTMGCSFSEAAERYMPEFEREEREKIFAEMLDENNVNLAKTGGNLYPNLENTLKELKNKYDLSIVSNCAGGYIEVFLESSGLGKYFIDFIAASAIKVSKAEAIKKMIITNNVKNAIYVGDTLKDFEAAKGAGIEFIYAKYGFGKNVESKYEINFIEELPELLNIIENES